ncbi:hypothetical protein CS533_18020 [Yersinia bercovieri]|uniref:Uncharacterized protein n=1 Tax=Yersinia bercovieri TaxID=634 RepID=A0A2G4TYK7_YERBE|nr:hypothetical protein CS533_18020 [Yersinia bercovieri]
MSLRNRRGDCTDGRSDGSRRYDPFGTFPRLSTLSAVCKRAITALFYGLTPVNTPLAQPAN